MTSVTFGSEAHGREAAERRQIIAHGVSRGWEIQSWGQPRRGERARFGCSFRSHTWIAAPVVGRLCNAPRAGAVRVSFLRPCRGLQSFCASDPRLAPWAAFLRRFAAGAFPGTGPRQRKRRGVGHRPFLSPLPGLGVGVPANPRLAPWATFLRRSAAGAFPPRLARNERERTWATGHSGM